MNRAKILWPSQNIWTLIQKWLTYLQVVIFDQGLFWADGAHLLKKFVNFPRICESILFCWILQYKFCIITKDRTWPRPFRGWRKNLAFFDKKLDYLVKLVKHENSTKQLKDHRCRVLVKIIWSDRNQDREPSFFFTFGVKQIMKCLFS